MHAVDYFYDLGQVNSLDPPSSRMEVPQYSNPMPFTLQNIATQVPQTPDFHFSLYVLLSPHEHSIHFQQSPITLYEGSQTFYTTLPIQVRNAAYTPRPSTSSISQPIQPQTSTPSQGSANAHCASLHQLQQCDCKQKQQWQTQEVQVMQGLQPEVMQALSKQQHHNSVPTNRDPDINSESKTPGSNSNTDPDLNFTLCNGNQGNCKRHCVSLSLAQSSSQELKSSCVKSESVHSIDQNEEFEKRLMMLTFEDAVMMFDFELFDNPKLTGQITEQDQYLQMQNKMRNENNQRNQSKRILAGHLSKERKSGSSELEAEHCPSIRLTLTRNSLSSFCAEAPCIPHRFTNDHSFYDLKPEQVNLQTLLELDDASDDESCWETLGCKSESAELDSSAGVETLSKVDNITNRKRKSQLLDLES